VLSGWGLSLPLDGLLPGSAVVVPRYGLSGDSGGFWGCGPRGESLDGFGVLTPMSDVSFTFMTPDSIIADLKALRELFSDPARWTQKVSARNARGEQVYPLDPSATCFCLLGGMVKVVSGDRRRYTMLYSVLDAEKPNGCQTLAHFNDRYRYESVLGLIRLALTGMDP
jgi:hypothetical protein